MTTLKKWSNNNIEIKQINVERKVTKRYKLMMVNFGGG